MSVQERAITSNVLNPVHVPIRTRQIHMARNGEVVLTICEMGLFGLTLLFYVNVLVLVILEWIHTLRGAGFVCQNRNAILLLGNPNKTDLVETAQHSKCPWRSNSRSCSL